MNFHGSTRIQKITNELGYVPRHYWEAVDFMIISDKENEYLKSEYRQIHNRKDIGMMIGEQIMYWVWNIQDLSFEHEGVVLQDFGCGKAWPYKKRHIHRLWNVDKVVLYDFGIPEYEKKPEIGEFNAIVSCDVLEHIPEEELDATLEYWYSNPNMKFVFATIAGYPARATLSDGRNAHVTIKPKEWWIEKIKPYVTCKTELIYFPEIGRQYKAERIILENNS